MNDHRTEHVTMNDPDDRFCNGVWIWLRGHDKAEPDAIEIGLGLAMGAIWEVKEACPALMDRLSRIEVAMIVDNVSRVRDDIVDMQPDIWAALEHSAPDATPDDDGELVTRKQIMKLAQRSESWLKRHKDLLPEPIMNRRPAMFRYGEVRECFVRHDRKFDRMPKTL